MYFLVDNQLDVASQLNNGGFMKIKYNGISVMTMKLYRIATDETVLCCVQLSLMSFRRLSSVAMSSSSSSTYAMGRFGLIDI